MATQNLYIPSSTGSYNSPFGNVRLRLYYETGSTVSETFDAPFFTNFKLAYDHRQIPDTGQMTLSGVKFKFFNKNNIFETHGGGLFSHASDKSLIFCDIILDNSKKWSGVIDYKKIRKEKYNADLEYNYITIPFIDKIRALDQSTLAEAGIASGDTINSMLSAMASEVDLSLSFGGLGIQFSEISGRSFSINGYSGTTDLKMTIDDTSQTCLSLLKDIAHDFGLMFYNYAGTLRMHLRSGLNFTAIDPAGDDLPIRKIEKMYPLTYVAVKGSMDWTKIRELSNANDLGLPDDDTRRFSCGTENANSSQNFVLDTKILDKVYADIFSTGEIFTLDDDISPTSASDPSDRVNEIKISTAHAWGYTASGYEAESGMLAQVNFGTTTKEMFYSILTWQDSDSNSAFILSNGYTADDIDLTAVFRVLRKSGTSYYVNKLYKIYPIMRQVCENLGAAFLGDETLEIKTTEFRPPYQGFIFNGDNYVLGKIEYDFGSGVCVFEGDKVVATPTIAASNDVAESARTVEAVDDGTHKVSASAIWNHMHDKTLHWNHAPDDNGTSYAEIRSDNGTKIYVYWKEFERGGSKRFELTASEEWPFDEEI